MLAARNGLSPLMVGRSGALTRLSALISADRPDGATAVALVTGEAGVGKTRLVQELIRRVPERAVVLAGGAEPGSLGRPHELVRRVLDLSPSAPDEDGDFDAVLTRLGAGTAVAVFEDLHWADAESVAVFEGLAVARLPSVLLIGTCRPDELSRGLPAGEMVERLERRQFVHHVHLERLSRGDVAAFLGSVYGKVPPSTVVDALYGRTGGNPFFLEEILTVAGDVDPAELVRQPLPWTLAELVRGQVSGLSADERRLVEAAAVLGGRAEFDLLAVITRSGEDEMIPILRGLLERGLLLEECEDSFTFRHALVRDAVEQQLLGRERRRLHELALQALRDAGSDDLAALARHAHGAGHYEEFVALARQGVQHYLAGGSSHQALRLAVDALTEAPDDGELLSAAARAAWLLGLYDEALAHVQHWEVVARDRSLAERAAAARMLARVFHELDRAEEAWAVAHELEVLVDELDPGEDRALTMAGLAQLNMLRFRPETAISWADRAIAEADAVGAAGVRAQALIERASAMTDTGGPDGEAAMIEAIAEAEAVGDLVLVARGLNNMAKYHALSTPSGQQYLARLWEAAERAGFDGIGAHRYRYRLVEITVLTGDLAESRRHLDAVPWPTAPHAAAWHCVLDATLCVEEGRLAAAADTIADARPRSGFECAALATVALVVSALRSDAAGLEEAVRDIVESSGSGQDHLDHEVIVVRLEALARAQRPEHGAAMLASWRAVHAQHERVDTAAEGLLAALEGRPGDAVALLQVVVDDPNLAVAVYQRSWLRVALARSLATLGRTEEARAVAASARADLERWPGWRRDEIDALIAGLDPRPAPRPAASTAGGDLTVREREVAGLLAEGLTNVQLARRLHISPKTAAVHVSNILTKLDMSSRAEVAAWAVRNGLSDPRNDVAASS
jgi:DNA-binding CsgD family transcriptional regulator